MQRVVFISASYLQKEFSDIPNNVMENAIFFFGSDRKWIFPQNEQDRAESAQQPTKYLNFNDEFKQLILKKEGEGLVYWLKPNKSYEDVSRFFTTITDPCTGLPYKPLILDDNFWNNLPYDKVCYVNGRRVVMNYKTGEHDYDSVCELLVQSNRTLVPVLNKREIPSKLFSK